MDPLEFFPPEISLQCILDILPPRSHHYSHTILELASVSRRWQDFILSAPNLWVEINVDHTINDLLAIVSVFLTFSRALSLKIVIWEDLGESWNDVCSLLLPYTARISTLVYAGNLPSDLRSSQLVSVLSNVISSLGHPPNLSEVQFCDTISLTRSQIKSMGLPPDARITSHTYAEVLGIGVEMDQLSHITNLATFYTIEEMIPVLRWLPNLTEIRFTGGPPYEYPELPIPNENPLLPSLETLLNEDCYSGSLDRVVRNSASQLRSLSVLIRAEVELQMLLFTLRSLSKLQELHLDIFMDSNRSKVGPYPEYGDAIPSLHALSVSATHRWSDLALDINPLSKLFTLLEVIYPHAKKVTLNGTIGLLKLARRYLQGLLSVQSLHLEIPEDKVPGTREFRLQLPSLQALWTRGPVLQAYLDAPNLLHLVIWQVRSGPHLSDLSLLQLRRLEIQTASSSEVSTLTLDPAKYPALCELELSLAVPLVLWELTSFPKLMSIHLSSVGMMLPHANRLFMMLIYHPKMCPSLQRIRLADFVEWDLIFLMLQRRNFGNKGAKPINELIIPFVPPVFRTSLHLLVEGEASAMPEDLDMSLVTTREMICDATIPGCVRCLKYMRPHCSSVVELRPPLHFNVFYPPKYPEPPGNLPVETRARLARHHELAEEWRISFTAFQSKCFRVIMCDRAEPVGTSV